MIFKLIKILILLLQNIIFGISTIIPKDKNLLLFSSWNGMKFIDNPKYIYKYALVNGQKNLKIYWYSKNKILYLNMKAHGYPVIYAYSLKGFIYHLRASVLIFTHSVSWEFINFLTGTKVKKVLTWHGIPIKKIGIDHNVRENKFSVLFYKFFVIYNKESYDLIFACSEYDQKIYSTAFNVNISKVKITGYPRNDLILNYKKIYQIPKRYKIVYLPTYRGNVGSEFNLFRYFNIDDFDNILNKYNAVLEIKLHPVQILKNDDRQKFLKSKNIKFIKNDSFYDLYENIYNIDLLITDYSGIFFDYMLSDKPIILAPIDYSNYIKNDRDVYLDYINLFPNLCYSWQQVLVQLEKFLIGNYSNNMRTNLKSKFHLFLDSNSSRRALKEIINLIN